MKEGICVRGGDGPLAVPGGECVPRGGASVIEVTGGDVLARRLCSVIVGIAAIGCLATAGCGSKGLKLLKVSGTVKFKDGSAVPVPSGGKAVIAFQRVENPADASAESGPTRGASGDIKPDGTFVMQSVTPGDGVMPGKYKVTVTVWEQYMDPSTSLIPAKYGSPDTSDIPEVTIEKPVSDLVIQLDKK